MSKGINKMTILGNLGKDPECRDVTGGKIVTTLTIATTDTWTDSSGERKEETEWHRVVCWNRLAEIARDHLRKGRQVYIEGKKKTRSWTNDHGQKQYITEIIATDLQLCGGKGNDTPDQQPAPHDDVPL